jgi:hypothetical protein
MCQRERSSTLRPFCLSQLFKELDQRSDVSAVLNYDLRIPFSHSKELSPLAQLANSGCSKSHFPVPNTPSFEALVCFSSLLGTSHRKRHFRARPVRCEPCHGWTSGIYLRTLSSRAAIFSLSCSTFISSSCRDISICKSNISSVRFLRNSSGG